MEDYQKSILDLYKKINELENEILFLREQNDAYLKDIQNLRREIMMYINKSNLVMHHPV